MVSFRVSRMYPSSTDQFHHFQNVTISVVGTDREFTIYEDEKVDTYLQLIAGEERRGGAGGAAEDDAPAAPAAPAAEGGAAAEGDEMDTN